MSRGGRDTATPPPPGQRVPDQRAPNQRVIFIAGAGRSGSTLLDIVLGNHPEIVSVGELSKLVPSALVGREYCACGARGDECEFWREVVGQWLGGEAGEAEQREYLALQERFERTRRWPRLLAERRRASPRFLRYAERTAALFRAIARVSGKPVVLDSSKNPARAFALSLVPGLELAVIHLVRDPRGVAFSYQKAFARDERGGVQHDIAPRPAWRTALAWRFGNAAAERLMRGLAPGRAARLRYEDLVADPRRALAGLDAVLGMDLSALSERMAAGEEMAVHHTVAGSRLRMQGRVRLAADAAWSRAMPARDRRAVARLAGRALARYGYPTEAGER
jgi:hypothetical protein